MSASEKDYPVMFQAFNTAGIGLLNLICEATSHKASWITFIVPNNLQCLPDKAVEIGIGSVHRISPLVHNQIAYTPNILLYRTEVPLVSCMAKIESPHSIISNRGDLMAYGLVMRALYRHGGALLIADKVAAPITLSIDLLELRGIGYDDIFSGCARAVSHFATMCMFARSDHGLRWNPVPLVDALSSALAIPLSRALSHPVFLALQEWANVIVYTPMQYIEDPTRKRLHSVISYKAVKLILDPESHCYTSPILLYHDDQPDSALLACLGAFQRCTLRASIRGEISADKGYILARRYASMATRFSTQTLMKLAGLYRLCTTVSEWARQHNIEGLYEDLAHLLDGVRVRYTGVTLVSALRSTRKRIVIVREPSTPAPSVRSLSAVALPLVYGIGPSSNISLITDSPVYTSDEDYLRFRLRRLFGRQYGGISSAQYWAACIAPYLTEKQVFICGGGHGGVTSVAMHALASFIVVHDLARDVRPQCTMIREQRPFGAPASYPLSQLQRSTCGYSESGGDITKLSFWSDISTMRSAIDVFVLDVALPDLEAILLTYQRIAQHIGDCLVIHRVIGKRSNIKNIMVSLATDRCETAWGCVAYYKGWGEYVFVKVVEANSSYALTTGFTDEPPMITPTISPALFGGGRDWLACQHLGCLQDIVIDPQSQWTGAAISTSFSSADRDTRSYTHVAWAALLLRMLLAEVLRSEDPELAIVSILSQDEYGLTLGEGTLPVSVSLPFRKFLISVAPRFIV